jgi:hypothetical protein
MMICKKLLFRSKAIRIDQVYGSFQLAKNWPRMKSSLAQLKPVHMDKEKKKDRGGKGCGGSYIGRKLEQAAVAWR